MLQYYNEEKIAARLIRVLPHNKVAPRKRLIKRKQVVGKPRETLEDIYAMIVEMDADPNVIVQ